MKTVSITEAKRGLSGLLASEQTFEVTSRGLPIGALRVFARAKRDPERAKQAARRIAELSAAIKPNKSRGATSLIRSIRDDGE